MSKEKQIEEMARAMCAPRGGGSMNFKDCIECPCDKCCLYQELANSVYNAGYRKQEWISVEERLPERGESVLVYSSKYYPIVECRDLVTYMRMGNYSGVTHWMPLPERPMMKGGAG